MNGILQTMRESDREALSDALRCAGEACGLLDKQQIANAICAFLQCLPDSVAGLSVPRETLSRLIAEVVMLDQLDINRMKGIQDGASPASPAPH